MWGRYGVQEYLTGQGKGSEEFLGLRHTGLGGKGRGAEEEEEDEDEEKEKEKEGEEEESKLGRISSSLHFKWWKRGEVRV